MLSKLLPVILLIVGTAGGIGAGIMMAPPPEEEHADAEGEDAMDAEAEHEEEVSEEDKKIELEYHKIQNQFVIPVVVREELASLVVVSLSLEAKPGLMEKVHAFEPKLRDVFLQVLFDHANMGGFRGAFTRSEMMTPLRQALKEAAQKELGKGITDVLIVEISRQDVWRRAPSPASSKGREVRSHHDPCK